MFKPLNDRILLKQDKSPDKAGIIEVVSKKVPHRGRIVSRGPDVKVAVKDGDYAFYGDYAGTDIELDGEKFVIVREMDLLAVAE